MADDDEVRADAVRRAELAAFAESWQLLGLVAIVHLWPPMPRLRRGAPSRVSKAGAAGGWWRCACGTRRWRVRRAVRALRHLLVTGLVWTGISGTGLTPETTAGVRRWCDGLRQVPAPCCPLALDGLKPADPPR